MNMDELLERWRDGSASEADLRELTARLATPEHRDALLEDWLVESALPRALPAALVAAQRESAMTSGTKPSPRAEPKLWSGWLQRRPLTAAAALVLFLGIAGWWLRTPNISSESALARPTVGTLAEAEGAVWFREEGGAELQSVVPGAALPAGMLVTQNPMSAAVLRFADGTKISLSGGTEIRFMERGQKFIEVDHGVIRAAVAKQPKGKPMIVRTVTAEVEVVGTAFSLSAAEGNTSLSVDEGRVKLTRLVDGQSVDVPSGQRADASLNQRERLTATVQTQAGAVWVQDFSRQPANDWKGQWEDAPSGGSLLAAPHVVGRGPDGRPAVFYSVFSPNVWTRVGGALVTLEARSALTVEFREAAPQSVIEVMLVTHEHGRRFAGNYFYHITGTDGATLPDGWRRVRVPLAAPVKYGAGGSGSPTARGLGVFTVLLTSQEHDTGLRLRRIEISPQAP